MPMSIGGKFCHGGDRVIHLRHERPSLWHAGLAKDIEDLWEPWMREADRLLEDAALVESVYEAQGKRHPQSRSRGRAQTPAEVALRLLILKHVRNWSYDMLEREVRANLVYRAFTRIGDEKVPDAKTLARLGQVIGPEVIRNLHQRLMELARERGIVEGRRMRVDTTVVETNIHYPTDSSLLGDGARVLTRTMKKIEAKTGGLRKKIRDRMRTVKKRVMAIALATRQPGPQREERQRKPYAELLSVTRKILNQAQGVMEEVEHLAPLPPSRLGPDSESFASRSEVRRMVSAGAPLVAALAGGSPTQSPSLASSLCACGRESSCAARRSSPRSSSSCASRPVHRRRASCCQWDSECSFPLRSYPPASVVLPRSRAPVPIPSAAGANSGSLRDRSLVPAAPRSLHPALSHRRSA